MKLQEQIPLQYPVFLYKTVTRKKCKNVRQDLGLISLSPNTTYSCDLFLTIACSFLLKIPNYVLFHVKNDMLKKVQLSKLFQLTKMIFS